jgi:hypothetical protein
VLRTTTGCAILKPTAREQPKPHSLRRTSWRTSSSSSPSASSLRPLQLSSPSSVSVVGCSLWVSSPLSSQSSSLSAPWQRRSSLTLINNHPKKLYRSTPYISTLCGVLLLSKSFLPFVLRTATGCAILEPTARKQPKPHSL